MRAKDGWKRRMALFMILALCLTLGGAGAEQPEEGLLRAAVLVDITTMDVARTTDDYLIPMNVFDRLFETKTVDGTAQVVKSLCEDWSVSGDGLTYSFTLRPNIVFSNNSALTASDVQYSFERLLKENRYNYEIAEEIAGAEAVRKQEAESISGFTVTDDTHFSVTLKAPNAGFIAELSSPAMSILDAETMAQVTGFGTEPADTIGTGPYTITEWIPNDHYTLQVNPLYWGEAPTAKRVIVRVVPDAGTQNMMFRSGELDLIDLLGQDAAIVESEYKVNYPGRIVSAPRVGLTFIGLNEKQEFLKDVRVRRAIGMAVNVDQIISGIYNGNAVRENGIIPTGIWGHNSDLEGFTWDPAAARALLAEAGYADGTIHFELAMDSSATGAVQLVYQYVSQQLGEIGIKAEIHSYDHTAWIDKRLSGEMDAYIARWGMDYNDPANIMYTFFGGADKTAERSLNYPDTEIMARVAAASAIVDDAAREAEYQALEKKIISEDAAWIPLFEDLHLYCFGERVASFTPTWAGFSDFFAAETVMK